MFLDIDSWQYQNSIEISGTQVKIESSKYWKKQKSIGLLLDLVNFNSSK